MGSFKITALDHIVLNVGDIDRALKFYTEVLGLEGERVELFRVEKSRFSIGAHQRRHDHRSFPTQAG